MSTLPSPHRYEPDGIPTRPGGPEGCLHCPLPARHKAHDLPPVGEDVAQAEARKLGEER